MNSIVSEITKSITGKTSLYDCGVDELRQIAGQYPYFGPAQFLYLKKLKSENSPLLESQKQKASLYFQNPVWLEYLLDKNIAAPESESISEPLAEPQIEEAVTEVAMTDNVISSIHAEIEAPATFKEEEREDAVISSIHTEIETPATFEEVVDQTHSRQPEESVTIEKEPEPVSADPAPVEHLITQFKFQPIDPSKAAMTFEPYHTVDYFASQGIKPKEVEKPKDRFSKQLKSFTEWLKVMKRLPVSEIAATVSASDEKKVEQMAAVSINDREVVTEAMAEVWEKQGNHAKAIETYEKLSLLNPGKNSFFAAKIEHLKTL